MKQPTFKEQFDKLTEAYIKDEVNGYNCSQCFVGNLLQGNASWTSEEGFWTIPSDVRGFYSQQEVLMVEDIFMRPLTGFVCQLARKGIDGPPYAQDRYNNYIKAEAGYEDVLFEAFTLALDALKGVHIAHGEQIDDAPVFVKRKLAIA